MTPRRSTILDVTVRLVFDAAIVLSIYMLFAGHNQPGGGFVGGLVAAAALALRYIVGGIEQVRLPGDVQPWTLLSVGLAIASGLALALTAAGDGPLDQRAYGTHVALVGDVKFTTATVFDSGVYLIVIGLVLMIFEGLGDDAELDTSTTGEVVS